ncbi:LVIVD repeat-containing protein [Microbispora sp. NPDC049125]|uniref:LVIVD repeat-containing protein n=1 Tax=Microbispora sp. NPDC049125 TaxID=3154929 RepID=UPI0034663345
MLKAALAACLLVVTTAACTVTPASPQARSDGEETAAALPGQDEIRHSPNMKVVANVPLDAPFDGPQAWGTDLAFEGHYAFVGNYEGFTVHDIGDPAHPKAVARVSCPGGQNDVSVSGDLLFLSVDEPRTSDTCASEPGDSTSDGEWEGIRIFDISDKANPRYLKSVKTECGSHTNAIVPGKSADTLYLYVSSAGPEPGSKSCPAPHDNISIVEVPVDQPGDARVVAKPALFKGQDAEEGLGGCHDITAYPEKGLAAGACYGDGVLMDISDPVNPRVLQTVTDEENFSIWHSATFNNDGTKIVFSDELGGGMAATCVPSGSPTKGADAIYELTPDHRLTRKGYFKIPRMQSAKENCVAHNGSLVPVPGRDIMVQAWYMGGVSVFDFTDPAKPVEIAYFERGPLPPGDQLGGSWSAYYYNGYIYSSDITKGLDVLRVDDPITDPAKSLRFKELNVQSQRSYGRA